jgi:arylsulfatase A-like enzyme
MMFLVVAAGVGLPWGSAAYTRARRLRLHDPPTLGAYAALAAFTGRPVQAVAHPWGQHAGFARWGCPSTPAEGEALPPNPHRWPRWGDGDAAHAPACLCGGYGRVPLQCFPSFAESDLAQPVRPTNYNVLLVVMDTARADAFPFNGRCPLLPLAPDGGPRPRGGGGSSIWDDGQCDVDWNDPGRGPRALLERHVRARSGRVYTQAYAGAPWTLPSHAAMLTGVPADATGVFDDDHLLKVPQLGHHLGGRYCRVAHVANTNLLPDVPGKADGAALAGFDPRRPVAGWAPAADRHGMRSFGWTGAGGWDHYAYHDDSAAAAAAAEGPALPRGTATVAAGTAFLRRRHRQQQQQQQQLQQQPLAVTETDGASCVDDATRPFFLFVHTNRCHDYGLDPAAYPAGVAEADAQLAALLDVVDWASTVVVLTSDHGEGFEPARGRLHHSGRVDADVLAATLVVWHPDHDDDPTPAQDAHGVVTDATPVSALALAPSLLGWLGYTVPPYLVAPPLPLPLRAGGRGPLRLLHPGGGRDADATVADVTAVDQSYAWAYLPAHRRRWHGPIERVAAEHAADHSRVHPRVPSLDVRMTLRWPIKLVSVRIGDDDDGDAPAWHAAYDVAADPGEQTNLLGTGPLPLFAGRADNDREGTGSAAGTEAHTPDLAFMAPYYEVLRTMAAAIAACVPLQTIGYGPTESDRRPRTLVLTHTDMCACGRAPVTHRVTSLEDYLGTESVDYVQAAARQCPQLVALGYGVRVASRWVGGCG